MNRSYAESKKEATRKREFHEIPKSKGGRPPKYAEPRRPITVTLPERILQKLESADSDRSRAIVKCVEAMDWHENRPRKPVELIELTPGKALIVVGPSASLRMIAWLRLVEIVPFRYLLSLPPGTAVEVLEVALQDLLANPLSAAERALLSELLKVIRFQRRGRLLSSGEILFVDVPGKGVRREEPA
jgi:hypothetical protein